MCKMANKVSTFSLPLLFSIFVLDICVCQIPKSYDKIPNDSKNCPGPSGQGNCQMPSCLKPKKQMGVPSHTMPNWGGNFYFNTKNIQYASSVKEVQQIVRSAKKLRALGVGHSFSEIANSDDTILSTYTMNAVIGINFSVPSVTVQPGIIYTDLNPYLGLLFSFEFCLNYTMSQLRSGNQSDRDLTNIRANIYRRNFDLNFWQYLRFYWVCSPKFGRFVGN